MQETNTPLRPFRLLIFGVTIALVVLGAALIVLAIGRAGAPATPERVNALVNSENECVVCHQKTTPGIVEQYGVSTMAAAEVTCQQCHQVKADYPEAIEHEGVYILASPTTTMCATCHANEVAQYNQSRHALPAYVAVLGSKELSPEHLMMYEAIPEGSYAPDKSRNAIAEMEGPNMTRFTCEACHNIGRPAADGSVGQCQKCHLRHEFSLEQARKPETCNACHIGPDHPQYEIYIESPHGTAYHTMGPNWNWEAEPG
ncbi:MAG: hypothetical protein JXB15_04965, partial [Anaerolineales bacterium]|nr:hypothetical protein [Anaerolineales bacterium]